MVAEATLVLIWRASLPCTKSVRLPSYFPQMVYAIAHPTPRGTLGSGYVNAIQVAPK